MNLVAAVLLSTSLHAGAVPIPPKDDIARAWRLFDAGRGGEAQDVLEGLVRDRPRDDAVRRAFLEMASDRGEWSYARDMFLKELKARGDGLSAYWYFAAESDPVAAREAVGALRRRARKRDAHLSAAIAADEAADLAASGRQEAALAKLAKSGLERIDPAGLALARASILLSEGRLDEADAAAEEAGRLQPHDAANFGLRAQVRLMRGDADGYREMLGKALALGDFAFAHDGMAYGYALEGDEEDRKREYQNALLSPRDGDGWDCSVAEARAGLGQFWRAAAAGQETTAPDPRETCALGIRAGYLLHFGLGAQAQSEVEAVLNRNPHDLNALMVDARLLEMQGRKAEARARVETALSLAPGAPELLIMEGELLVSLGQLNAAFDVLQTAHNSAQNYVEYHRAAEDLARAQGDYWNLLFHAGSLEQKGIDEYESWSAVGDAETGLGWFDRAAAAYERARAKAPDEAARKSLGARIEAARKSEAARLARYPKDAAPAALVLRRVNAPAERREAAFERARSAIVGCPWEPQSNWRQAKIPGYYFYRLDWSPDGRTVYTPWPGAWTAIDAASGRIREVLKPDSPDESVLGAFFGADPDKADLVVAQRSDGALWPSSIEEYRLKDGRRKALAAMKRSQIAVFDDVSGKVFLFGGGNRLLDTRSGSVGDLPLIGCRLDIDVSPGGGEAACVDARDPEGALVLFDFASKKRTLIGATGSQPKWSPDGRSIAYYWRAGELRVYDVATGRVTALKTGLEPDLEDPFFSPQLAGAPVWSSDSRFLFYHLRSLRDPASGKQVWDASFVADLKRREVWTSLDDFEQFSWAPVPKS